MWLAFKSLMKMIWLERLNSDKSSMIVEFSAAEEELKRMYIQQQSTGESVGPTSQPRMILESVSKMGVGRKKCILLSSLQLPSHPCHHHCSF